MYSLYRIEGFLSRYIRLVLFAFEFFRLITEGMEWFAKKCCATRPPAAERFETGNKCKTPAAEEYQQGSGGVSCCAGKGAVL